MTNQGIRLVPYWNVNTYGVAMAEELLKLD